MTYTYRNKQWVLDNGDFPSVTANDISGATTTGKAVLTGTAAQGLTALGAEATVNKGAANGYAGLDSSGKVPSAQLPAASGGGGGDASTNTSVSVDSEMVLFAGTSGKVFKRATSTGLVKLSSGVLASAVAGTDYYAPGTTISASDVAVLNQNTTGSAAKLTTARTLQTNLASSSSASFDGTANVTPGVSGTLPVANGGTGAATLTGIIKGTGTTALVAATAGTDYVAPNGALGTPTSGTLTNCTGLTIAGITASTTSALGVGTIEVGHASDTTLSRLSAGVLAVEGVAVPTTTSTSTLTNKTLTNPVISNYTESLYSMGTVTTSAIIDLTNGTVQTVTLTASTSCTFTLPTATAGKSFSLLVKQAATTGLGSAVFTGVKWAGAAPTITASPASMDIVSFMADGTNWYGAISQGYST